MKQTSLSTSYARVKRLLAAMLSLVMVLSLLPGSLFSTAAAQDAQIPTNINTSRIVYVKGNATGNGNGSSPENAFTTLEAAFAALSAGSGDAVIVICGTVEVAKSYNNLTVANGKVTWDGVYYITGDYGTDYSDSALIQFTNSSTANINMGGKTHFSNLKMQLDNGGVTFYTAGGMTIGEGVECEIKSNKTFSIYGGCWEGDYEGDVAIKVSSGKIGTIMGGTKDYTVKGAVNITVGGSAEITGNITSAYKKTTGNVNLTVNGGEINTIYAVGRKDGTIGGDLTINLNAGEITQITDHSGTGQKAKSVTVNLKPACQIGTFAALASGRVTATNGTTLNLLGYNGTLPAGILHCFGSVNVKDSSKATYTSALGASTAVVVESGSTLRLGGNENGTGLNVSGDVKYGMPVASVLYVNGEKVYGSGETPDGSKTAPYTSLADAYACIDDEAGGTVVIMGDTKWDGDYSGYGITGTVNITSSYDGDSYITGDDPAYLVLTGDVTLSDSTNIDNVKVNVNAPKMFLYTGMELTIGSNVTMSDGVKDAALKVVCGKDGSTATKGQKISVSIASGKYHTIFMGNTNDVDTGSVDLTLSGTANVWSNVQVSPNKGSAEALHFTMEGNSDVKCIYNSGGTDGAVAGNITIDLKSGTIEKMRQVGTKKPTTGDITVNLYGGFQYGSGSFGTWNGVKTGTRTLNLIGFNDTLSTGAAANYKVLCVKNASNVTYAGTLASGSTVTAETGSVLTLTGYADQATAEAAGQSVNGNKDGYGTILFGDQTITYPERVYINTDASITTRDGLTPATGVASLQDAIQLLNPNEGGTIVLCSALVMSSDVNLESYNISGQVTLTSVDGTTDYRTSGARLTWQGNKRSLIGSGNMVITDLNFHLNSGAKDSVFIYSGEYLRITDTVANTANSSGNLKIFVSKLASTQNDNCVAYVYGGTYNQIYIGSNATVSGDATMYFGGNAFVVSNVACGPNSTGSVGNATFNMEGGYVKVIYDTSNTGSTVRGNLTLNLTGGTITEMRDYNGKNGITIGGNITVNVGSQFNCGTAKFGVWSSGVVSVGGTKTLNLTNYQGMDMNSLDIYDCVNVFGGELPAGFVNSGTAGSLNIYNYSGIVGLSLTSFDTVTLTGDGSKITFLGEVPTSAANPTNLVANDGTTMYIRASANPNVERADYAITENGTGRVMLDDPAYTGSEPVLKIDFDNNNAGTVTGGTYGTSYNGTKALVLSNKYNAADSQYLTISAADLNGLDISRDNFSISMWYYGVYAGMNRWVGSNDATTAGAGIDMAGNTKFGGMLLSNRDETNTANTGFSVAMLPQNQYMTVGVSGQNGACSTDGIRDASDAAWHQVVFTVDRSGFMSIYVDGAKAAVLHIAEEAGVALGSNSLTIGADTLGHYGIGLSYFDDIAIYSGVLSHMDIMAQYAVQHLQGLTYEISQRVESVGAEYTEDMKSAITAANDSAIALLNTVTFADYPTALSAAKALKKAFDAFLLAPEKDAGMVAIMFSDIHITTNGDTTTKALEMAIKDVIGNKLRIDTFINSGDIANDSSSGAMNESFQAYADLFAKYALDWQMLACVGNHDTQYTNENACYNSSMPIYWKNMEDYIGALDANGNLENSGKKYGDGKLVSVYQDSYSYLMEMDGYYYLVLNTENPGQTGDASKYTNEDGSYSIEGNQYDPIRHGMWFSDGYLKWIEDMMALSSESGNPIFVVGHFPFVDSCPLSTYSNISINDNSIGSQDAEVRSILCKYENVFYFCGHLHNSVSLGATWEVSDGNGSFTEVNLPAIKNSVRGYADIPVSWIMYVYNEEIVLRCRNYLTGEWLTQFDATIKIICSHTNLTKTEAEAATCTEDGILAHYTCAGCGSIFADAEGKNVMTSTVDPAPGHKLTKQDGKAATCTEDGVLTHYTCSGCDSIFADAEGKETLKSAVAPKCHSLSKVDGKAATVTENGVKEHYACTSCGKLYADAEGKTETTKNQIVINATGNSSDTGDKAMLAPAMILIILSMAGMIVMIGGKKQWER